MANEELRRILTLPMIGRSPKQDQVPLLPRIKKTPSPAWRLERPPSRPGLNPIVKDNYFQEMDSYSEASTCDTSEVLN